MKIVYCTDSICYAGGIQRITISKANALSQIDGNEVWIIVTDNKQKPVLPIDSKVHIIDLDINYFADDWKSKWHVLKGIFIKRRLHKKKLAVVLNEIKPDIVISTGTSEKNFLPSISISSKPVFIREIHNTKNYRSLAATNVFYKTLAFWGDTIDYNIYIKRYHRIVVLTNEDKETNWKYDDNVVVIPNPLTSPCTLQSSLENKTVIAVGRLVPQKNFSSLIEAWAHVAEKHPDWTLEIWGEGYLRIELENLIAKLNLKKHVFLKGYSYDIQIQMQKASIFVLSSIFEGFGLVIIEAMSCGLPVVSYDCPCGPKDIITEGKDGYLIPINNEEKLAYKIGLLIENSNLRKKMGQKAIDKAQSYNIESINAQWMNLFYSLIKKH